MSRRPPFGLRPSFPPGQAPPAVRPYALLAPLRLPPPCLPAARTLPLADRWVGDQGPEPTCTAFAVAGALEVQARTNLSERSCLDAAKRATGADPTESLSFADAFAGARAFGLLAERHWPYDRRVPVPRGEGKPRTRLASAASIEVSAEAARETIGGLGRPVACGLYAIGGGWDRSAELIRLPDDAERAAATGPDGALLGDHFHAVLLVGYRPGHLLVRNSWGTGWSRRGLRWMPDRYLEELATELWVATPAP